MRLFIGLGNPGAQYAHNRHNIGFMAVEAMARRHNFSPFKSGRFSAEISEGRFGSEKALLIKPQTYMNKSGQSVGEAMRYFKLTPEDVFVFYDEADLAAGKLRYKLGGGAAGHNGIKSITQHIGSDFHRIRMGVGHPREAGHEQELSKHVLSDFSKSDTEWLDPMLDAVADQAGYLANGDGPRFLTAVANQINPNPNKGGGKNTDEKDPE